MADTLDPKDYLPMNQVQKLLMEKRRRENPLYAGSTFARPEERFLDTDDRDVQEFVETTGGS